MMRENDSDTIVLLSAYSFQCEATNFVIGGNAVKDHRTPFRLQYRARFE